MLKPRVDRLLKLFVEAFGESSEKIRVFNAPGRVNLIGEHTDYNGGYVFPAAIDYGTLAAARRRDDGILNLASTNFSLRVSEPLADLSYKKENDWANYPLGVAAQLQLFCSQKGESDASRSQACRIGGADILFSGNIPNGAGLSSSASIELVTALALTSLYGIEIDRVEMAKLCQRAENEFVGVKCGIMDQYAVGMGRRDQAILLDCLHIKHRLIPLVLPGSRLVVTNTNKRRGLADTKYNERRAECERGMELLKRAFPEKEFLGELSVEEYESVKDLLAHDPVVKRRVEHVIYENHRVLEAVESLERNDPARFGELMIASHNSLRNLYEVTGIELDTLVEESLKVPGVIGSRMTGAGFGGCTVSIVAEKSIDEFKARVSELYTSKTGLTPDFYVCSTDDGAKEIEKSSICSIQHVNMPSSPSRHRG